MKKIRDCGVFGIVLVGVPFITHGWSFFSASRYPPHSFCYLDQPELIWTNAVMDGVIAASYVAISLCLFWMAGRLRRSPELRSHLWILLCFGTFILAGAGTHVMEIVTLWWPVYWASATVKTLCAAASAITAILLSRAMGVSVGRLQQFLDTTALNRKEQLSDALRRKQAEEMRERLAAIVDCSDDAIVSCDLEGIITAWNCGASRLSGYSENEALGQSLSRLLAPPERSDEDARIIVRIADGESFEHVETVLVRKDSKRVHVSATVSPVRDSGGKIIGVSRIARDISEKLEAEGRLKTQAAELEQSRRAWEKQTVQVSELNKQLEQRVAERTAQLEAAHRELELFTYSVSHDLRAPLRHVTGFSRILQNDFGNTLQAEAKELLERIAEGVARMGKLIDGLLSLARLSQQAVQVKHTEMNAILSQVISVLQPECEGREVQWRVAALPPLPCDPVLMFQVLQNLLCNALKYSRGRAPAVIEVDSLQRPGEPVAIFVRDNGAGFDMKYAKRLFGAFQRMHAESEFEGTGLGLATVQRIIQKHGGSVWAEAEVERGATFYFTVGGIDAISVTQKVATADQSHSR